MATLETKIFHSSSFELIPHADPATNEILSVGLKFNGIEMTFLMGRPDNRSGFGAHRPKRLIFKNEEVHSTINFNWQGRKGSNDVTYLHAGAYSGLALDHVFDEK